MKKILLTLGAIGAIVTPVVSVVACGTSSYNFDADKKLVLDSQKSSKDEGAMTSGAYKVGQAVTSADLGIPTPAFKDGAKVTYKVKTPYTPESQMIVVTATITHGSATATKDVTVYTYGFKGAINKAAQGSLKIAQKYITGAKMKAGATVTQAELNMGASVNSWHLGPNEGLKITMAENWDGKSNKIKINVSLTWKTITTMPIEVTVTLS